MLDKLMPTDVMALRVWPVPNSEGVAIYLRANSIISIAKKVCK